MGKTGEKSLNVSSGRQEELLRWEMIEIPSSQIHDSRKKHTLKVRCPFMKVSSNIFY
jgi:hypothetical protein